MKKCAFFLLICNVFIIGMEQPPRSSQRGQKRSATENPAPAAKEAAIESKTAFELLPNEIKKDILSFLTTAKGPTNRARLDIAAENIRSFFRINSQFKTLGQDQHIIEYLITQLADRYANGDKVTAAIALGTEAAGIWLRNNLPLELNTNATDWERRKRNERSVDINFLEAVRNGRYNVVAFLLHFVPHKINLSWGDALKLAVEHNHTQMVRIILNDPVVNTAIIHDEIMQAINDEEIDVSLLALEAIDNNNEQILNLLLDKGANIDIGDDHHIASPVLRAMKNGNISILRKIIQHVPTLVNEIIIHGSNARTPLMQAAFLGNLEMVTFLLGAGAQVNYINHSNNTALKLAEQSKNKNAAAIVKLLKERGATSS